MQLIWSPLAINRVIEIAQYIALDNPKAAQRWVNRLFQAVERLVLSPELGRVVPEIKQPCFRELIHGNYRIIYKFETEQIIIITVRHGKQLLPINEITSPPDYFNQESR